MLQTRQFSPPTLFHEQLRKILGFAGLFELESVVFIMTAHALGTHHFKGFVNLQYFKLVLAENFVGLILTRIRTIFQISKF